MLFEQKYKLCPKCGAEVCIEADEDGAKFYYCNGECTWSEEIQVSDD